PSRTGAASDVNHRASTTNSKRIEALAQGAGKSIGIRTEEDAVSRIGRKGGMDKQLPAKRRETHIATQAIAVALQLARQFQQVQYAIRQFGGGKWPIPPEHPFENLPTPTRLFVHAQVACRRDRRELITPCP